MLSVNKKIRKFTQVLTIFLKLPAHSIYWTHVFGQIKRYCIRYVSVCLGGGWIWCRPVQRRCYGCLSWRWTRTGILRSTVSFGLHALLVFEFVVFFQVVE